MAKYVCTVCGYVYDEAAGDPDNGIAPGTKWEDIPDDFTCPLCGVGKEDFEEEACTVSGSRSCGSRCAFYMKKGRNFPPRD